MKKNAVLCGFLLFAPLLSICADTWDDGLSFGGEYRNHFGANMSSSVVDPMTKGKDFVTKDGTESFSADMTCNAQAKKFLEVGYTVLNRNNIKPFVKIDKLLNGNFTTYTSPYTAQGVCSNGLVVCPANSNFDGSSNCKFYKWEFASGGVRLGNNPTPRNEMSDCICINNACYSPSVNNRKMVLSLLGGGVYGVLSSNRKDVVITEEPQSANTIFYMGQDTSECTNTSTGALPNLQPGKNSIDPSSEVAAQSSDDKSAYSSLMGASGNYADKSPQIQSDVSTTITSSKNTRNTLEHTDGTTSFKAKGQDGTALNADVNVRLDLDQLKYCQVEWDVLAPSVFTDDTERTSVNSGNPVESETRECVNSVCPFQPSIGERIKHDCDEIDNFNQVTSALMAVQEMAGDITCGSI